MFNARAMKLPDPENPNVGDTYPWTGDILSWFIESDYLSCEEPVPISIGGVEGMQTTVKLSTVPSIQPQFHPFPTIRVFFMPPGVTHFLNEGSHYQIMELSDVGGEKVLIIIGGPAAQADPFLPQAQEILRSVEWRIEHSAADNL